MKIVASIAMIVTAAGLLAADMILPKFSDAALSKIQQKLSQCDHSKVTVVIQYQSGDPKARTLSRQVERVFKGAGFTAVSTQTQDNDTAPNTYATLDNIQDKSLIDGVKLLFSERKTDLKYLYFHTDASKRQVVYVRFGPQE